MKTYQFLFLYIESTLKHCPQWLRDYVSQPGWGPQGSSHIQHCRRLNYHWTNYPPTACQYSLSEWFIYFSLILWAMHFPIPVLYATHKQASPAFSFYAIVSHCMLCMPYHCMPLHFLFTDFRLHTVFLNLAMCTDNRKIVSHNQITRYLIT